MRFADKMLRGPLSNLTRNGLARRFLSGAFWSLAGVIAARGLGVIASVAVARILGRDGFGEYGMMSSTTAMFQAVAGLGLGATATKHLAALKTTDPIRAGRIVGMSTSLAIVTGLAVGAVLFATAPWLARTALGAPHLAKGLRIGSGGIAIGALLGAQNGSLVGFESFRSIAAINLIAGLITVPISIGGAIWLGVEGAVWATTLSMFVQCVLNHAMVRRESRRVGVPIEYLRWRKEYGVLLGFALPTLLVGVMAGPINWAAATILVNHRNGYAELGLFNAAAQWRNIISIAPSVLVPVVLPILASRTEDGFPTESRRRLRLTMTAAVAGCIAPGILILGCAPAIPYAYGKGYGLSVQLIAVAALVGTLSNVGSMLFTFLQAVNKVWLGLWGNLVWAATLLAVFCVVLPKHAVGLAWANAIAFAVSLLVIAPPMIRQIRGSLQPAKTKGVVFT